MSERHNIRVCGFGGQGVILCGYVIGRAGALYDNKNSAFTQSYGPEARGGACSSCVVIEPGRIGYPLVKEADYLLCLSKEGYEKFGGMVHDNSLVFVDSDLVEPLPEQPYAPN